MEKALDKIGWKAKWRIDKFRDSENKVAEALQAGMSMNEALRLFGDVYIDKEEWEGNVALNEGLQALIGLIAGTSSETAWNNANARLGVSDSNAAESATQTGLQGTNKTWKAMDATYPQRTDQTCEWRATFGSGDANYAWEEYTVVNAADDSSKNLNRKTTSKGTKASGETWTLSLQITFS
jgi:hypothetical protein